MSAPKPLVKVTGRPGHRTSIPRVRMYEGKQVKPVLYCGKHEGYGTYIAGAIDGELVCSPNGKPLPFKQIGTLERA